MFNARFDRKKIWWSTPQENTDVGRSHTHIKYEPEDWYKTAINSHKDISSSSFCFTQSILTCHQQIKNAPAKKSQNIFKQNPFTLLTQLEGKYSLESTDPRESEIRAHLRP